MKSCSQQGAEQYRCVQPAPISPACLFPSQSYILAPNLELWQVLCLLAGPRTCLKVLTLAFAHRVPRVRRAVDPPLASPRPTQLPQPPRRPALTAHSNRSSGFILCAPQLYPESHILSYKVLPAAQEWLMSHIWLSLVLSLRAEHVILCTCKKSAHSC